MAAPKCPATLALQRKLTQAMGTCAACAPQVEYLESLAGTCPQIGEQVANLRVLLDHLETMSKVGLMLTNDEPDGGSAEE